MDIRILNNEEFMKNILNGITYTIWASNLSSISISIIS